MKLQESGEMYLESIYLLQKKNGTVRSVDIASFTGYSKPSVSRAVGLLKKANLVSVSEEGHVALTSEGVSIAERMYERHTVLTDFFVSLGVPKVVATQDACRIEHIISDVTFTALKKHVEG